MSLVNCCILWYWVSYLPSCWFPQFPLTNRAHVVVVVEFIHCPINDSTWMLWIHVTCEYTRHVNTRHVRRVYTCHMWIHTSCVHMSHVNTHVVCTHVTCVHTTCVHMWHVNTHVVCIHMSHVYTRRVYTCHMWIHTTCVHMWHVYTRRVYTCHMWIHTTCVFTCDMWIHTSCVFTCDMWHVNRRDMWIHMWHVNTCEQMTVVWISEWMCCCCYCSIGESSTRVSSHISSTLECWRYTPALCTVQYVTYTPPFTVKPPPVS